MWRLRGTVLYVDTPGKNVKIPVCGAMCYPDGPFVYHAGPAYTNVKTDTFIGMLRKLAVRARRSGKRMILVLDNGSAHTSKAAQKEIAAHKDVISIFWLPTYTSEQLNDIEGLWGHLKDDYFSRMLAKSARTFVKTVVDLLDQFSRPGALRRMLMPSKDLEYLRNYFARSA
jgi:transposase